MTSVPVEFRQFALRMHQDIDLLISMKDEMELVQYLAGAPKKDEDRLAVDFLDELLASERSNDDLTAIWAQAGADWYVTGDGIRHLLTTLRDYLRDRSR